MVEFALNDAQTMKEYLVRVFGYKPGNIFYLPNATFAQMREYFGTEIDPGALANHVKQGRSDVFVYYSGHGAPDVETKKPYFVPVDCGTNPTSLRNNGYPVDLLYKKLADLPDRSVTLVVDA